MIGLGKRHWIWLLGTLIVCLSFIQSAHAAEVEIIEPHPGMILPFMLLLLCIAVIPLINRHWWDKHYPYFSLGFGLVVVAYYAFVLRNMPRMLLTALDYFSFICLIGSLFVVTGGIFIKVHRDGTPLLNTAILLVGAIVCNVIGTTGASALLIRPFIRLNKDRIRPYHVVFFIFLVSNIGGVLTPIGDPPLFLGYLKGVPFFWVIQRVWYIWVIAVGALLTVFFIVDSLSYARSSSEAKDELSGEIKLVGYRHFVFLLAIVVAVFLKTPIREAVMIAAAAISHKLAQKEALLDNEFNFNPIREVAILFAGIFATMVPALDWLELNAGTLGISSPGHFFWGSGTLSSVLDNAPTYLNFLSAAFGLHHLDLDNVDHMHQFLSNHWKYLQAISVGAVFFGANTYIGNGPNFMVKSISEHLGAHCPSFFGYVIKYSVPILIPLFAVIWFLFFRQ